MLSMLNPLRRIPAIRLVRAFHVSRIIASQRKKIIQNFKLADIGEGITECEIIKWNVKPSTAIQAFDPLCEVQSDKASVEITSPFEGVVKELLVKEGEMAKVGEGLCLIEVEEEADEAEETPSVSPPAAQSELKQTESEITPEQQPSVTRATSQSRSQRHPLDPNNTDTSKANVLSTPSVRHFAKQNNVDISSLSPGSGKGGRVERKDVEDYLAGTSSSKESSLSVLISEERPKEDVVVQLGRTRLAMWNAMTKSLEIPHFGYSTYLDVTKLHQLLPNLNANIPSRFLPPDLRIDYSDASVSPFSIFGKDSSENEENGDNPLEQYTRMTMLPILLKTLSRAMMEWPLFRSSITPSHAQEEKKPSITLRPQADISIALSTPTGLYTPTITRVNTLSSYEIMGQLRRLSNLGRRRPIGLGPKDMPKKGGTLTVSNVGAIGQGEFASPVLVPGGGVAIVALGRANWVPTIVDAEGEEGVQEGVGKRLRMGVSWSADHRVVEGAELAAFMECWRGWVEDPTRLVGDGR